MKCTCNPLPEGEIRTSVKGCMSDCPEHGLDSEWYNSDEQLDLRLAHLAVVFNQVTPIRDLGKSHE